MIRRPPRSTLFPTRRSSDLDPAWHRGPARVGAPGHPPRSQHRAGGVARRGAALGRDRKSTRLNSSHITISYAVFCLKKKKRRQKKKTATKVQRDRYSGTPK